MNLNKYLQSIFIKNIGLLLVVVFYFMGCTALYAQEKEKEGEKVEKKQKWKPFQNTKSLFKKQRSDVSNDSLLKSQTEASALSIGSDRGFFILSHDKLMQLRILGSVRAEFDYNDREMLTRNSFNPYEIPTTNEMRSPNYYSSLSQTRLGFEVTRSTKDYGNLFIRIEGDFNTTTKSYRIRHAYGQIDKWLIGQTWSLYSNVSYVPPTVNFDGPASSAMLRTPQIRYYHYVNEKIDYNVGVEYSVPDIILIDSISTTSLLQVIPDVTGRIRYKKGPLKLDFSGIVTTISSRNDSVDKISYSFGLGGMVAGKYTLNDTEQFYFSANVGRAVSHYINMFSGKGEDATYNANDKNYEAQVSFGGFFAYQRDLSEKFSAYAMFGIEDINNKDFQPDNTYSSSYSVLFDLFWTPLEGAKVGAEYIFGQRFNRGGDRGFAGRFGLLIYYDF